MPIAVEESAVTHTIERTFMSYHDNSARNAPTEPEGDADLLIRELTELTRKKKRFAQASWAMMGIMFVAIAATLLAIFVFRVKAPWASFLSLGSAVANLLARRAMASDYEHSLAQSLKRWGDVRAIGPLAQALSIRRIDQAVVTSALTTLLPKLKPSDAPLLDRGQRAALYTALKLDPDKHAEFLVALLGGLAQLGGSAALPHVERLIDHLAATQRADTVLEAALVCKPALEEAVRLEREKQTLLRPAAETEPAETLLRPAASVRQTDEAILLRPHNQEDAS
jgi:hypothetical protein